MYEFTAIRRQEPLTKSSKERVKNFGEIYEVYSEEEASQQASRCLQCGNPYCSSSGCPLHNHIPHWLKFIAEKDKDLAFQMSNETSPFPEILGRICPQDRLCEGACTLNDGHGAVSIGSIEVAITESGFSEGLSLPFPGITTDKSVGIIGSGPAGLSCATFLLRAGIKPVIYERADQAGGLLTYGIPNFKLDKASVQRRIDLLTTNGMELVLNTSVGKDISFDELNARHDCVFLALGATEGKVLNYQGYSSDNVYMAVPFLSAIQKKLEEKGADPKYDVKGKSVIVIGGGDTAMDCVRTSIREGATEVKCLYRRGEENMPGSKREFKSAKEEGVEFVFYHAPKAFITDSRGNVQGVRFVQTEVQSSNGSNRGRLIELSNTDTVLQADVVILALGFDQEKVNFLQENGIETNKWGGIVVDENLQTSREGVFAGGDGVRGADLVVTAAFDGREAAMQMIEKLVVS
ncbi:glutamate synthase subunit beta [Cytophagales bacterium RKSG123]|nr:glutamate synthase subunit beta [Xanthovirga aplysinae]